MIKTHDKGFLIKEVSKEERDFLQGILLGYHRHLSTNPHSLLAQIYGLYAVKLQRKKKVYHVLMRNLDPMDEEVLFKYDMKFSTVNRQELRDKEEVDFVKYDLGRQYEHVSELFPEKRKHDPEEEDEKEGFDAGL